MKIGITCYPTYGGSGIVATELGLELAQRGHEIHFITYAQPIRLTPQPNIHYHEVEVSQYPLFEYPPYDLALATRMAEVATIYGLDLLHVHYAIPHSVSAMLARQMLAHGNGTRRRLPFVTTLHGTDITIVGLDRSYLPITRYSIEQSDGVTAISNYLREKTYQEFDVRRDIEVIHNFVNCDVYQRDVDSVKRRREFALEHERVLVHISNFRPVKRLTDVIEIFDLVQKEIPSKLLLIGDGPERSRAEWMVTRKGIRDRVVFLGKQDRIHEKLPMADVLLMPSELESFGLSALEAMACEVVPVATRVGGVPEVVDHGETGYLAEVGDVQEMARCAIEILRDEDRLRAMGKVARRRARERFCASKIIPQYERFYRSVVEQA